MKKLHLGISEKKQSVIEVVTMSFCVITKTGPLSLRGKSFVRPQGHRLPSSSLTAF